MIADWVTLAAAVVAAGAAIYAATKATRIEQQLALGRIEHERELQLRPHRAELYAQLTRQLRGAERPEPPPPSQLNEPGRVVLARLFTTIMKQSQARHFAANEVLADIRLQASKPVREAAEEAVEALRLFAGTWLRIALEDDQGESDHVTELFEGDLAAAQDRLKAAIERFEDSARDELFGVGAA